MTGEYRGPAHNKCNKNVTQKQSNFIAIAFQNSTNYDCHLCLKKLVDEKNDYVKFDLLPKTKEYCFSVTNGCIRRIDSYRFLSRALDELVKRLDNDGFIFFKKSR